MKQKTPLEASKMEMIRAFIAIQIPEEIKNKFAEVQRKLEVSGADVRWVKPHNAHATLQFLGDTPTDKIEEIKEAIGRVAASHHAFDVSIEGLGAFPNERRPRVVWIGVMQGADSLASLQKSVSEEMKRLGFQPEEREYSPHITLGRVKSPKNTDKLMRLLDAERHFQAGKFHATEIHLIRSILSPEGPTYSTIFFSTLAPPPV